MNNLLSRFRILALMAMILVSASSAFAQQKIAIVDAGSSKSKLYVYDVDTVSKNIRPVISLSPQNALPLSMFANVDNAAQNYIKAMTELYSPADSIDLYILATAGMRTVDSAKARDIYDKIKKTTPTGKYKIKEAMTISGRYEGLYAWIAANYEKNTLPGRNGVTREKSWGILEIGGASMQIAGESNTNTTDTIMRNGAAIYSKSYISGGVNTIQDSCQAKPDIKKEDIYKENVPLLGEEKTKISNTKFYGLGRTITGTNTNEKGDSFKSKVCSALSDQNNKFKSNVEYLKWVLEQLDLLEGKRIDPLEADWTKGAAYDILINHQEPKAFDYQNPN